MKLKKNKTTNFDKKTILLGMSGGVDSSIAALLLKKQGYKVIGAFMKCFSDTKNKLTGDCNYLEDLKMARKIALKLNIPLIVLDFEDEYKKHVVNSMFNSYKKGLTPNPDMLCNKIIKFPLLWKVAQKHNCNYIATGHYARIKKSNQNYNLLIGKDKTKDQSYFLAELTQKDLSHTLFPLGNLRKEKVRQIAKRNHFPNADRPGTAGVCFVGNIYFHNFLKQRIRIHVGKVLSPENKVLGTHQGLAYYTIGQKAGEHIGIKIDKPQGQEQKRFYIAEKKKNNTLVVAPEGHPALKRKQVKLINLHFINQKEKPKNLKARIRHLGQLHPGKLIKKTFIFNKGIEGLASGQFLVLYSKDKIIASGEIRI